MSVLSNNDSTPLKPKLLPTPFDNIKSNENVKSSSFAIPKIYNQEVTAFPPWYDPAKNVDYNHTKIKLEDPTICSKWDFPSSNLFQFPKAPKLPNFYHNKDFYCDSCDRSFQDMISLQKHQAEHMTCNIQGCKFRAHTKIVSLHKKMQHHTGLAKKIMSLDTPEDIQKWREDRKRNFPTSENRERKKQEEEDKKTRGEVLTNKYFGKMRGRGNNRNHNHTLPQNEANHNQQHKSNYIRGRGRGQRGRGRFRGNNRNHANFEKPVNEFSRSQNKTKSHSFKRTITSTEAKEPVLKRFEGILKNYDEEEDINESETISKTQIKKPKITDMINQDLEIEDIDTSSNKIKEIRKIEGTSHKLATNVNLIETDDIQALTINEFKKKDNANPSISSKPELEEGEITPDEEEMEDFTKVEIKTPEGGKTIANNQEMKATEIKDIKNKNFFEATDSDDEMSKETSSKHGQRNEKSENSPGTSGALSSLMQNYGSDSDNDQPVEVSSKIKPQKNIFEPRKEIKTIPAPNLYPIRKRQTTLLEKLLSNEIRHERNVILQCVHYIVKNNFFDNSNKHTE